VGREGMSGKGKKREKERERRDREEKRGTEGSPKETKSPAIPRSVYKSLNSAFHPYEVGKSNTYLLSWD